MHAKLFAAALTLFALSCGFSFSQSQSRYHYCIENLSTPALVRRAVVGSNGIPQDDLILRPNTRYRAWMLEASSFNMGHVDFVTPAPGGRFTIPPIPLQLPLSADFDNDGLPDDAEFIVGLNPRKADTDGDGVQDGAAVSLGLLGANSITGIIGSVDTPGTAVDVCAFNDLAIVADSDQGVTIFNVFNGMAPLIIAQVDTPGIATRVSCSGDYIAVADGQFGLAIIAITNAVNAQVVHQLTRASLDNTAAGGTVNAVATAGTIAYVGLNSGRLVVVDLPSGGILDRLDIGGNPQDLAINGDVLLRSHLDRLHGMNLIASWGAKD